MNQPTQQHVRLSGPVIMFVTAAIFGYFGFAMGFSSINVATGLTIPYVIIFMNTMKIGAVAFAVCGILTLVNRVYGNIIYNLLSILAAVLLVIVAILDLLDQQTSLMPGGPYILIIVAAFMAIMSGNELIKLVRSRTQELTHSFRDETNADIDRRDP